MYTCTDAQWAQDGLNREDTGVTLDVTYHTCALCTHLCITLYVTHHTYVHTHTCTDEKTQNLYVTYHTYVQLYTDTCTDEKTHG